MKPTILILITLLVANIFPMSAQNTGNSFYSNPVIGGDLPDPSIIRVGDTYYATATTNDFAPVYPVFESKDMVNWKQISAVFMEPPTWTSKDFWAPELFYQNGTFYVYYTAKRRDTGVSCVGVATTKDIYKGFTDHGILIEWGEEAIDGFVFRDDDNKLYISWKAYGLTQGREIELLCSEMSDDGLSLMGEPFSLTDRSKNWEEEAGEGQVLLRRNDYYYLLYSAGGCCTNGCNYHVRVARSKNLRSGWEQLKEPILQSGDVWRCTGHGTAVTTPDNRYFYLYHSYYAPDFEYIGREVLLDELFWNDTTGWPYFKNSVSSTKSEMPVVGTRQQVTTSYFNDFSGTDNLNFWEWDVKQSKPEIQVEYGELIITTPHDGLSFLGFRPEDGHYEFSSELIQTDEPAGIGIYSNPKNVVALLVSNSELKIIQLNNGEERTFLNQKIENVGSVHLKFEAIAGRYFQFFKSEDGKEWIPLKIGDAFQLDCDFMPQWNHAPRVGFIGGGKKGTTSRFRNLSVQYLKDKF